MSSATSADAAGAGQMPEGNSGVLPQPTVVEVQPKESAPLQGSAAPDDISLLGEPVQSKDAQQSPPIGSDQPKTLWFMNCTELFAFILSKNSALRADLKGEVFTLYDLSTQALLQMLSVESKDAFFTEIGLDPSEKKFKSIMFESFLITEILADTSIPQHIRDYWLGVRTSKLKSSPINSQAQSNSENLQEIAKRLEFDALKTPSKPSSLQLPGCATPISTPSFYKHIEGSTNSFFHMLSPQAALLQPAVATIGENGHMTFSINMMPSATVVHEFPTLNSFSKLSISPFLLKFKTAQLGAPVGAKKSLKNCINPLIWSNVARCCGVDLSEFEQSTTDQQIYASLLQKYGPTTCDEAMTMLKEIVFEFDDSITPQEMFVEALTAHFVKFREQLSQFLYCKFDEGEELTPEACMMCLKDNFHHNPMIKGPDNGKLVRKSSNNAYILEKIQLMKHLPMSEIMDKLIQGFEEDDKVSRRRGYKVTPWILKANGSHSQDKFRNGGISKQRINGPPKSFEKIEPCCKCGRQHASTIDTCLLFDHPDAGKEAKWPAGKPPMKLDTPELWTAWISKKELSHPDLVKDFKRKSADRKANNQSGQGRRGGGSGKPPPHPNRGNFQNRSVNNKQYLSFDSLAAGGDMIDQSDGAIHCGHADHATSDECNADDLQVRGRSTITLDEITEPCFDAIGRFKKENAANGKKLPSTRRDKALKVLMDPGSQANFISQKALHRILVLESSDEIQCQITQNESPMGDVCRRCVLLQFKLDLLRKAEVKHKEWFIVSNDINYDVVIGTKFCRENGYTSFHAKLTPWNKRVVDGHDAFEETPRPSEPKSQPHGARATNEDTDVPMLTDAELAAKQSEFDAAMSHVPPSMFNEHCSKHPVTSRPIIRDPNASAPTPSVHKGAHASAENLRAMEEECKYIIANESHRRQCKIIRVMSENRKAQEAFMSADEVEASIKNEKQAAIDAEKFFRDNEQYLQPKNVFVPSKKHARYYEPVAFDALSAGTAQQPQEPTDQPPSSRLFVDNQMVLIKGLVNHVDLNGVPARILSYDEDSRKYTISVAKPRGYWLIAETFLKSLDVVKKGKHDIGPKELGIDPESGQPTLDPLERPVHRQYGSHHSKELSARIALLLEKYKLVFSTDITEPCEFKAMKIKLKPNAALPRNARLWKNSPLIRAEIRRQLQKMIDMKIVTKSESAIVSNVLMVKRPGMPGKFRFTVDFRAVNDATEGEPWQMPSVEDQLSRLKGKKIFGCVDASSYYHQICLDKESRYLTGFVTEDGVYEYARVPMGVKNACAHAQRELQMALDEDPILRKHGIRNYFDDIPLAADTPDDFIEILTALCELAQRLKLKFNLEKSVFGVDSITHCGFIVSGRGVEIDPMRTESIRTMEEPQSLKKVQAVLGTLNYVRHFIKDFSLLAKPLTDLLTTKGSKTSRHFCWTDTCSKAFHAIKQAALDAPLLEVIDFTKEVYIRCDSSQFGQGAVLFQFDDEGREHVIAYASRKYSMSERNWATFQQEASAIVWALEKFHEFIGGSPVIVQTDHKNLSWISKSIMPQLTRWRLRLQDFDFHVEFIPGRLNECSDGLSRLQVDDDDIPISMRDFLPPAAAAASLLNERIPMRCLNNYHLRSVSQGKPSKTESEIIWEARSVQSSDDNEQQEEAADAGSAARQLPSHDERFRAMQAYQSDLPALEADDDSEAEDDDSDVPAVRPDIPELDRSEQVSPAEIKGIIESVHGDIVGHGGTYVSLQRILRHKKAWSSQTKMLQDIDQFISGCPTCQKFKKRHDSATNNRFFIEGSPFSEISVDILNLPKPDCYGNAYVVMIVDSFTRFVFAVPVPDKTAINAGRAIMQSIGIFGAPITIRSDGGGEFVGDIIKSIEIMTDVKHHRIQPYQHTGNSIVERMNRSVLEHMRTLVWDKRLQFNGEYMWSDLLPMACRIINASFNSSIGCSPSSLLFGDNVDMDRCILSSPPRPCRKEAFDYATQLSANQRILLEASSDFQDKLHAKNLAKWRLNQKPGNMMDLAAQSENPAHDTLHWVVAKIEADAPHSKLKPRWSGPFILMGFKTESRSMVKLWDTVDRKLREAPINSVAEWKCDFENSTEGLTRFRETDYADLSYPMEAILGVALDTKDPSIDPTPLSANHVRDKPKDHYVFSIKWRGYHEPTWRPYKVIKRTSLFPLFAASRPNMNL